MKTTDNIVLDVSELRKKWAADDLYSAIESLKEDFDTIEDITIAQDIVDLFQALQTYLKVQNENCPIMRENN